MTTTTSLRLFRGRQGFERNAELNKERAKKFDGVANWNKEIGLRKDDMRLKFVFLNELEAEDVEDENDMIIQYYEHRYVMGTAMSKSGKPFGTNIPCLESEEKDCLVKEEDGDHPRATYRWAANVLVLDVQRKSPETGRWEACEIDGDDLDAEKGPWQKRAFDERIRILTQGNDSGKSLVYYQEEEGTLIPREVRDDGKIMARPYFLIRFHDGKRTAYRLEKEDKKPSPPELIEKALAARYDIKEFLVERQDFGLKHIGAREIPKSADNGKGAGGKPKPKAKVSSKVAVSDDDLSDFTPLTESDFDDDAADPDEDLIG